VIYKAEHDGCRRFPEPASGDLKAGVNRNFQVFDPLDFLAEITQHVPNSGEHTIRYYGWYSNKSRGMRKKQAAPGTNTGQSEPMPDNTQFGKLCRSRWAAMIKKVYETDPLECPKCGGRMRIISFIEKIDQADIIERILRHCGLWTETKERSPPNEAETVPLERIYVPMDEFLANF